MTRTRASGYGCRSISYPLNAETKGSRDTSPPTLQNFLQGYPTNPSVFLRPNQDVNEWLFHQTSAPFPGFARNAHACPSKLQAEPFFHLISQE